MNLIVRSLLKRFFLSIFFILSVFSLISSENIKLEFYRSNYNGLMLLEIENNEISEYRYYLKVEYNENLISRKILYENNNEIKRWENRYNNKVISEEKYFLKKVMDTQTFFNKKGYKERVLEYNRGRLIRTTNYKYNSDDLVKEENIFDHILNEKEKISYTYDKDLRIKQIIKELDNGKMIYWDCLFTSKGIIYKEYYKSGNETFIFYYNLNGQELRGEVIENLDNNEVQQTSKWENIFINGRRVKRIDEDFTNNVKTISFFNTDELEEKREFYRNDNLTKTDYFKYNDDKNIVEHRIVEDLNELIYQYQHRGGEIVSENIYENGKLIKKIQYNPDGSRTETITTSHGKITKSYDKNDNLINSK